MLPAFLHATAFAISLFVQSMNSPLAGAWLLFHLAGCATLLYGGGYPKSHGIVWYGALGWLLALGMSTFLFAPVQGGAATMWILVAMPSLALCLRPEHLKPYGVGFLTVIVCYSLGLILQMALHTQTTLFNYPGRYAWPLLDPNNAAAVVNLALLPCVWLALFKDTRWSVLCALFAIALYATGSKAGFSVAALGSLALFSARYGAPFLASAALSSAVSAVLVFFSCPDLIVLMSHSFADRFPIWNASVPLLGIRPVTGLGLGSFAHYYARVRTEEYTVGWHSHNDVLQVAIEAGLPAALVFCALFAAIALTTRRGNLAAGCALLAVFAQSMVEFQFYIPAVSIPLGLALAFHMHPRKATR
jgi:O-antigen ligase